MVELIAVVAIITILMGVAFVGVTRHQRRMKGLEADSAARELFIAAQNHLIAAKSQGVLKDYPAVKAGTSVEGNENEYLVLHNSGGVVPDMWEVMLPFGAIDETVRAGGSYIIHYNLKTATVLDVFFSFGDGKRFGHDLNLGNNTVSFSYANLMTTAKGADKKEDRRTKFGRAVVGWYGGEGLTAPDDYLAEPTIKVINADKLQVEISPLAAKSGDLKQGSSLSLIVTGVSSVARKEIRLVAGGSPQPANFVRKQLPEDALLTLTTIDQYVVVLDDVTTESGRFHSVMMDTGTGTTLNLGDCSGTFIPGEDLDIRAVAFDNTILSNIAESGTVRVNSLFGSLTKGGPDTTDPTKTIPDTVTISSFRHLENLDSTISRLYWDKLKEKEAIASESTIGARQDSDLDWPTFLRNTSRSYSYRPVIPRKTAAAGTNAPIPVIYDAGEVKTVNNTPVLVSHSISNLSVTLSADNANAGLFDTLPDGSKVSSLDLVNFNIPVGSGEKKTALKAGALAGVANAELTNVKAWNDIAGLGVTTDSAFGISGSGSVGGLVGDFTGSANGCAAAVYVKSTGGSAGGLFGTVSGGTVKNSYSGGHTVDGKYKVNPTKVKDSSNKVIGYTYTAESGDNAAGRLNVMGTTAGGLIGTLSGGTVSNCYSTCSAGGTMAGGFVGSATGGSTNANCYCTGLVAYQSGNDYKVLEKPTDAFVSLGVFAGSASVNLNGKYLDIVNYFSTKITGVTGNQKAEKAEQSDQIAKVGTGISDGVTAFDNDTSGDKSAAENYDSFVRPENGPSVTGVPYDPTIFEQSEKVLNASNQTTGVRFSLHGLVEKSGEKVVFQQETHYGDWPIYETYVVNS